MSVPMMPGGIAFTLISCGPTNNPPGFHPVGSLRNKPGRLVVAPQGGRLVRH